MTESVLSRPVTGPSADLAASTMVHGVAPAPGWYTAKLPSSWNFLTPSGGVLMTVALRAMQAELGDESFRPVSATTVFCSPVPHGPLEIRVEILRRGGAAAQVRAALSSTSIPGPGLEVSATFARDQSGPNLLAATPPDVPSPDQSASAADDEPRNPHTRAPFFRNFDVRIAQGQRWWSSNWNKGPATCARWFRYLKPQRGVGDVFDRLAIPPIADTMPAALINGLGPDVERFYAPSLDLTVHWLEDTTSEWLLVRGYARTTRVGYATAEVEIWSPEGRLVAYGTQMMILRGQRPA